MENLPVDHFTTTSAYTPHVHRDTYPAIDPTAPQNSQAGKVVIITGASAGIGARGFAPAFARANAKGIILVGRNQAKLDETAAIVKKTNPKVEVVTSSTEINNETAVAKLYELVKQKFGHADILINNAGLWAEQAPLLSSTPDKWWADFEVNVKGTYLVTRGFLSLLGTERKGYVVSMNTGIAGMISPTMSSYSISKTAELRLVEYFAAEHSNVQHISLQPGVVATEMVVDAFKRFALDTPELVGDIGVWLSTDAAEFLNGRFISANWDVEDLMEMKEKIVSGNDLKMVYQGRFGLDQFSEEEKKVNGIH